MTIREALRLAAARLEQAGVPDADVDAAYLLASVLKEDTLAMRINGHRELAAPQRAAFDALCDRRAAREPLQYILGETEFMGLTFHVEPGVLIPRADTEILVEKALAWMKPGARVLDIGTGSGAIAVSLAKLGRQAQVTAVDVSDRALEIARQNAKRNGAAVEFVKSDCFSALKGRKYDMIVSNPPYISEDEMRGLMPEVTREPELALFGGADGLDFYRRISREAPEYLNEGGCLLFEIGWLQKDAVSALVKAHIGEPFALREEGGRMLKKLDWVHPRMEELGMLLSDPAVVQDQEKWRALMREHSQLEPLDQAVCRYAELEDAQKQARALLDDPDMAEMAKEELAELERRLAATRREIQLLLLPKDPNAERNVVMEIRGGAGGEEAALFGAMLMRMYMRYAERHGWKTEMLEASMTELGGVKEAVFAIAGEGAFSRLKYESGVHRVQRIPVTESNGKRQTSTATVAVLPEAEEVDVKINPDDLRIDVYRASGHGGQYINKTDSAVRITHIPSGIVVTCQDEKSQLKNKEKAMRVLRARLYEKLQEEKDAAYASDRRAQVGTGDRSERIRTYNFNEGRVTDHRIGKTIYAIDAFVDGDMDDIIDPLIYADQQEQLRALGQGEWQRG